MTHFHPKAKGGHPMTSLLLHPILRCLSTLTGGRQFGKLRPKGRERSSMAIRELFTVLSLVAMFAVVFSPERGSGQLSSCVKCDECPFESDQPDGGEMCWGADPLIPTLPIGRADCTHGDEVCTCEARGLMWCYEQKSQLTPEEQDIRLGEVLAAITAGRSIPADGLFFYMRRGSDFVVRRKCDAAEVARLAIAAVQSAPVLLGRG